LQELSRSLIFIGFGGEPTIWGLGLGPMQIWVLGILGWLQMLQSAELIYDWNKSDNHNDT
jgi:hypothetical protein